MFKPKCRDFGNVQPSGPPITMSIITNSVPTNTGNRSMKRKYLFILLKKSKKSYKKNKPDTFFSIKIHDAVATMDFLNKMDQKVLDLFWVFLSTHVRTYPIDQIVITAVQPVLPQICTESYLRLKLITLVRKCLCL